MRNLIHKIVIFTLLMAGAATHVLAAQSLPLYFLKIDGIDGDSTVVTHPKEAEINAFSFGVSNSGTTHTGGGGGAGKANFQDLSVSKRQDSFTTELFLACASGKHFPKAILTARFADGQKEDYLRITLTNVLVTSLQEGSGGVDGVFENASLNFEKITIEVRKRDSKGELSEWKLAGWDIATNTKI